MMGVYVYHGPTSGVTLADGTEVMLFDGVEVTLPDRNRYVSALLARGHLVPVPGKRRKTKKPKEATHDSEFSTRR
jgi:hypothetical protein